MALAFVPDADAAVICQRKKKLRIRETACKAKEMLVQDLQQVGTDVQGLGTTVQNLGAELDALGADVADHEMRLDGENARVNFVVDQLRLACAAAPELVLAEKDLLPNQNPIGCGGGCRIHDGDPAACEGAWAVSRSGATSCFFFEDVCLPCANCGEDVPACTNACKEQVIVTCPTDPTRTVFAGGPGTAACAQFATQEACEMAFHVNGFGEPASCAWRADGCVGCGPTNETNEDCVNTCRTRTCADATRTALRSCVSRRRARSLRGELGASPELAQS
jgi:hypothetical protein